MFALLGASIVGIFMIGTSEIVKGVELQVSVASNTITASAPAIVTKTAAGSRVTTRLNLSKPTWKEPEIDFLLDMSVSIEGCHHIGELNIKTLSWAEPAETDIELSQIRDPNGDYGSAVLTLGGSAILENQGDTLVAFEGPSPACSGTLMITREHVEALGEWRLGTNL